MVSLSRLKTQVVFFFFFRFFFPPKKKQCIWSMVHAWMHEWHTIDVEG